MSSTRTAPPRLLLLLTCALLGPACAAADHTVPPPVKLVREVQHPNGLTVGVPEGFDVVTAPTGFVFSPVENRDLVLRNPVLAQVSLATRFQGGLPLSRTKSFGGRDFRYRVTKDDGGSGGEHYHLTVYERVPGGFIAYEQTARSETGEPDFALCWTLVTSAKFQQHKDSWKPAF